MIVHIIIFQSLRRLLCVSNQLCITSRAKIDPKIEIIYARREILTRRKMLKLNHNHSMFTPPLCFPANYPNSRFCHQGMGIKLIKRGFDCVSEAGSVVKIINWSSEQN